MNMNAIILAVITTTYYIIDDIEYLILMFDNQILMSYINFKFFDGCIVNEKYCQNKNQL